MGSELLGPALVAQRDVACRRPAGGLRNATYALGVVASLCLGCEAPDLTYGDCEVTCENRCPSGMQCDHGFCVHPDSRRTCSSVLANSGGATNTTGEVVATVDSRSGSTVIAQGTGERATATSGIVGIDGTSTFTGGVGSASSATRVGSTVGTTSGSGGVGGYTSGTGGLAGGGSTEMVMWAGASGVGTAHTCTDAPVVATSQLPSGCIGEQYSASLTATGDNPEELEWIVVFPEASGLTLSSNVILGVLPDAGNYPLQVTVRNKRTQCNSAPVVLSVTVHGETTLSCPTIGISGKDSSLTPPAPSCRGWPYRISFEAKGGTGSYDLKVTEFPPGQFQYDASTGSVQGTPTGDGNVTVQLTDGGQRVVQKTFPIPMRDKCWLAFVSQDPSAERLHLLDPLLGHDVVRPRTEELGARVIDYRFSPNGRFLAYRVMDTIGGYQLRLWQGPDWQREQLLDMGRGSTVQHYSWSSNSRTLAIAYDDENGTTWLGGVDVTAVPEPSIGTNIENLRVLTAIEAPVQSDPVWFAADNYIAFHHPASPEPSLERVVKYAPYGALGFSSPLASGSAWYDPSVILLPSATGFFAEELASAYLNYYDVGMSGWIPHGNDVIAPNGLHTAHVTDGELMLFRAFDDSEFDGAPYARSNGCSAILAWSKQLDRIACVDDGQGNVKIHTLTSTNLVTATLDESEGYAGAAWFGSRRALSPSGKWLALTTPDDLYVALLEPPTPRILWRSRLPDSVAPKRLSFSPDEQLLFVHNGRSLRAFTLESASGEGIDLGNARDDVEGCQEDNLPLPNWCGNGATRGAAVWSSDSQLLAFVNEHDALVVRDLRIRPISLRSETIEIHAQCGGACASGFRFQP